MALEVLAKKNPFCVPIFKKGVAGANKNTLERLSPHPGPSWKHSHGAKGSADLHGEKFRLKELRKGGNFSGKHVSFAQATL